MSEVVAVSRNRAFFRATGDLPINRWLIGVASVLLGLLLSLDRLPIPVATQVLPPTVLACIILLPFVILRIKQTPLLQAIGVFVLFLLAHSIVALFFGVVVLGENPIRFQAWIRQVVALGGGATVFLVLRVLLRKVPEKRLALGILIGALPAIGVGVANVLWGLTGSAVGEIIVTAVRPIIGIGEASVATALVDRATGLSNEPSTFGLYLATIVFPLAVAALTLTKRRWKVLLFMAVLLLALGWTFSTTAYAVLLSLLCAGVVFGPRRRGFLVALAFCLAVGFTLFQLFPENYFLALIQEREALEARGETQGTFTSKVYSTIGPVLMASESYTLIGYGLGATATHLADVVPPIAVDDIMEVSWEGMPNLKTLFGRVLAEGGIFGVALLGLMFGVAFWQANRVMHVLDRGARVVASARLALGALALASIIGLGSFAMPHIWLWFAIVDSRYMLLPRIGGSRPSLDSLRPNARSPRGAGSPQEPL